MSVDSHGTVLSVRPRRDGVIEGNLAALYGQLQLPGDVESNLIVDSREVLAGTTRFVGARFGPIEVDTYIAQATFYVEQGMDPSGKTHATKWALANQVYGSSRIGGANYAQVTKALLNLFRLELHAAGYNAASDEYESEFLELDRLLVKLRFDRQITLRTAAPERYDAAAIGAQRDSTVQTQFADWHVRQIRGGYWASLDWEKLRSLAGAAKILWLLLSSPRIPFAALPQSPQLEELHVPLEVGSYRALGIKAKQDRDCRRVLSQAGQRIAAVDPSYEDIAVVPDRTRPKGFALSVVRRTAQSPLFGIPALRADAA